MLVAVLSVAGYTIAFWGFRLTRHSGGSLHVARGLLTTRATSIEERRIRGVGLRVGRGSERGGTLLLPPGPRAVEVAVEAAVLGTATPGVAELVGRGAAARRRRFVRALWPTCLVVGGLAVWALAGSLPGWIAIWSVLLLPAAVVVGRDRFASLGHALVVDPEDGRGWLVTRYGSLVRRRCVLDTDGVIGVTMRQSVFQRRPGLTSLTVTTAAGRQRYPVTDLTDSVAVELTRQLVPVSSTFVTAGTADAPAQNELVPVTTGAAS